MNHRVVRRGIVSCGAVALAVLAAAPVARAADPVRLDADDLLVAVGTAGGSRTALSIEGGSYTGVTLTVDAAGLAGRGTLEDWDPRCTRSGTTVTCARPALTAPTSDLYISVVAAQGTVAGDTGTLTWTFAADGVPATRTTSAVRFAEGVDVANVPVGDGTLSTRPGATMTYPLAVRVNSATGADGVILWSSTGTRNVEYARRGSNCLYTDAVVACRFDRRLAGRTIYDLESPVAVNVRKDAPAPTGYGTSFFWDTLDDGQRWWDSVRRQGGKAGTGPALTLLPRPIHSRFQTDPEPGNNHGTFDVRITGSNRADQYTTGGTFRGPVGSVVHAGAGLFNRGPARADYGLDGVHASPGVHVIAPSNATVAPDGAYGCVRAENGEPDPDSAEVAGAKELICYARFRYNAFSPGDAMQWRLRFTLTAATGTSGAVKVLTGGFAEEPTLDSNAADNTAALVLEEGPAGGGGGGDDGGLPVTGAATGTIAAAGAAIVALGAAGFVAARRRRTRFTA